MTKKQENETSKELGMESKKNSGKSGKLKISVSAIRKGEKKTENKKPGQRRRRNHSGNDQARRRRPAAQDLLKDLKQKQRADEVQLNEQSQAAKKEYRKSLNKPAEEAKPEVKKAEVKKVETAEAPKVRGPKILKPSPARLK